MSGMKKKIPDVDTLIDMIKLIPYKDQKISPIKTFVFDDVESIIKNNENISNLFLNGRHKNIQCILIAHSAKNISKQIRQNITNILITTSNTPELIKDLKELYNIKEPIEQFREEHGMMLCNIRSWTIILHNKNNVQKSNKVNYTDSLLIYKNNFSLSKEEKLYVIKVLETVSSPLNIPKELLYYYLCLYFLKQGYKDVNIAKISHIYSDQNELNENGLLLFNNVKKNLTEVTDVLLKTKTAINTGKAIYNNSS